MILVLMSEGEDEQRQKMFSWKCPLKAKVDKTVILQGKRNKGGVRIKDVESNSVVAG